MLSAYHSFKKNLIGEKNTLLYIKKHGRHGITARTFIAVAIYQSKEVFNAAILGKMSFKDADIVTVFDVTNHTQGCVWYYHFKLIIYTLKMTYILPY